MSDALQKQLAVLKTNYLNSLPSKIDELSQIWAAAAETQDEEKAIEFHRKVHSLAGSGATFDQLQLSKVSKMLENHVKDHMATGDLFSDESTSTVQSYIERIGHSYGENAAVEVEKKEKAASTKTLSAEERKKSKAVRPETIPMSIVVDKMKILVADDDLEIRRRLELILLSAGHEVFVADDGQEAVEKALQYNPDVILMDVIMPVMTGYDAARQIKQEATSRFVPILFLTAITDNDSLAGCISAGGDDFLNKPVHPLILNAKLAAFQRISKMYEKLDEYQIKNEEEMEASKEVFASLIYANDQKIEGLQTWNKSPGHFSGDTHLYTEMENGHIFVLLCDFTGHGLPAAIGTVFVSDLFRSMTSKNIPAIAILNEINTKMNQILPTGRYCAAILLDYYPVENSIMLWNCGLPDAYVTDENRKIKMVYPSESVPLGVLSGEVSAVPYEIDVNEINEIIIFSDGITEAESPNGDMYGDKRLITLIENSGKENDLFTVIKTELEIFMDGEEPTDDISLIVFDFKNQEEIK